MKGIRARKPRMRLSNITMTTRMLRRSPSCFKPESNHISLTTRTQRPYAVRCELRRAPHLREDEGGHGVDGVLVEKGVAPLPAVSVRDRSHTRTRHIARSGLAHEVRLSAEQDLHENNNALNRCEALVRTQRPRHLH